MKKNLFKELFLGVVAAITLGIHQYINNVEINFINIFLTVVLIFCLIMLGTLSALKEETILKWQ